MCEFAATLLVLEALTLGQRNLCSTLSPPVDVIVTVENTAGDTGDEMPVPRQGKSFAVIDFVSVKTR